MRWLDNFFVAVCNNCPCIPPASLVGFVIVFFCFLLCFYFSYCLIPPELRCLIQCGGRWNEPPELVKVGSNFHQWGSERQPLPAQLWGSAWASAWRGPVLVHTTPLNISAWQESFTAQLIMKTIAHTPLGFVCRCTWLRITVVLFKLLDRLLNKKSHKCDGVKD